MFLNGSSEDLLCLFFYSITIIIIFNWLSYFFHICSVLFCFSVKQVDSRARSRIQETLWPDRSGLIYTKGTYKKHTLTHSHVHDQQLCLNSGNDATLQHLHNCSLHQLLDMMLFCEKMMILLCGI